MFEWLCYRLLFIYIYVHVYFSLLGEWRNHEWFPSAGLPIIIACVRSRVRKSYNLSIASLHFDQDCVYRLVSTESQKLWTSWLYEFSSHLNKIIVYQNVTKVSNKKVFTYLHCIRHSMIYNNDC